MSDDGVAKGYSRSLWLSLGVVGFIAAMGGGYAYYQYSQKKKDAATGDDITAKKSLVDEGLTLLTSAGDIAAYKKAGDTLSTSELTKINDFLKAVKDKNQSVIDKDKVEMNALFKKIGIET